MKTTLGSIKKILLAAFIGAAVTYGALHLTNNDFIQRQQIILLESRIQDLETMLTQKDEALMNANFFDLKNINQRRPMAASKPTNRTLPVADQQQLQSSDSAPEIASSTPGSDQTLKDLMTQSDLDDRSFSEKINDLLVREPTQENVAIASKGIFDMAGNTDSLPDYALEMLYQNQTDPDVKRVAAQVLSLRGDNRLMEKQITDAQAGLKNANPAERQKALIALGKTHYVSAANAIAPLLQDANNSVKLDALLALRATGNQSHVRLVANLINDPDPAVSWLANDVIRHLEILSDTARTRLASGDIAAELPVIATP